ncbi:PHP domain-containing protein [Staphylospora marina]|uniref:PHP domain-containing protein n=1 Tax=Staphylospora marina TaxID=2490858 RepID=UPI000F5B8CC4|nr:PHP domain-containing protein [Staphylospora marina]
MNILDDLTPGTFDLHIHTTASDGLYSPAAIVELAASIGLQTISITDHDTMDGVEEAKEAGKRLGIRVIPGVEITTRFKGKNVDVLGYHIRDQQKISRRLETFRKAREERAAKIIEKFCENGMPITLEDVRRFSKGGVIARPHIARAVVMKGYAFDTREVFEHYLADGKPCDVPKKELPLEAGVEMIREAGGVAVLAHPVLLKDFKLVEEILEQGMDGIEVWHRKHTRHDTKELLRLAERHRLVVTGGSDFHTEDHPLGRFM